MLARVRSIPISKPIAALAAALTLLALPAAAPASERSTARYLQTIRDDPAALRDFLWAMPKGADLHNHLSGSVYAESMVRWGAEDGVCVSTTTWVARPGPCAEGERPLADALSDGTLYDAVLRAWSMKGFRDGEVSGHDHFFATFGRFGGANTRRAGDMLAEVTRRAAAQNEQYLETMLTPASSAVWALAEQAGWAGDLEAQHRRLLDAGLRGLVAQGRAQLDAMIARQRELLACDTPAADRACSLPVRFQAQVSRGAPPNVVFAQMALGFELMAADGRWVAVNLVQPEDGPVALRDYRLHMRMLRFLRERYDAGHLTLHAGELVPGLAPPADLRFHVREAVEVAGAERIGHGVDVLYERDPAGLLRTMARRGILVETALTSNRQILGVRGRRHPIRRYVRAGVPVALATDDEGVSRTDLTAQFEQAVTEHGFGYRALKRFARDSLRHAFLPDAEKAAALRAQRAAFERFERRF